MKGVLILSIKKPAYSLAAFNLALSIKHFNPNIHITLVSDGNHKSCFFPEHYTVFDTFKEISKDDFYDADWVFQPAKAKLSIYKYSDYKQSLYIDADSLVLQDISPLFDKLKGNNFKGNVLDPYTQWTTPENYKDFFGLEVGKTINSSWFYFEKNNVFKQAEKFYSKGFDVTKIEPRWGGTLPDELFFNGAINKLGIDPSVDLNVMFFGNQIDKRTLSEIEQDFYAFTLYGGQRTVRDIYITWYDKLLFKLCTAKGIEHRFKAHEILKGKHVLSK